MQYGMAILNQAFTSFSSAMDFLISSFFLATDLLGRWIWTTISEVLAWAFDWAITALYAVGIGGLPANAPQGLVVRKAFYFADQFLPVAEMITLYILVWGIVGHLRVVRWSLSFTPFVNAG